METADILLALGGDKGNTVPKRVTAAEIPVLRAIHGDDAVLDIRPVGESSVPMAAEVRRLKETYGGAQDENGNRVVDQVYPGTAPVAFTRIADLDLPEECFAVVQRVSAAPKAQAEDVPQPPAAKRGRGKKAEILPPQPVDADDADELPEVPADDEGGVLE